ncbi:hypothetical protein BGZ72_006381 [Mortierella alpina]|nr:hypothetical protein BGZ72_006381 [Mortierella alpina]
MKFTILSSLLALALVSSSSSTAVYADPSSVSKAPVDLTLFVMSRCPDAFTCEDTFSKVLDTKDLPPVNFSLSYFGKVISTSGKLSVICKHGELECQGNRQQLCFRKFFPDHKTWFSFVVQMNSRRPTQIGNKAYAREIGEEIVGKSDLLDRVEECAGGQEGLDLLIASAKNTEGQGVQSSCTVFINNKKRCVIDGGEWRECPGGSTVPDFVKSIEDASAPLEQAKSRRFRLNWY